MELTNTDRTSVRNCVLSVLTDLISCGQVQGWDIIIIMQRDGPNSFDDCEANSLLWFVDPHSGDLQSHYVFPTCF